MTTNLPYGLDLLGTRTVDEIRDQHLRDVVVASRQAGLPEPDVSPGSFDFIRATNLALHLALLEAHALHLREQLDPENLSGDALERRTARHGLQRRTRSGSVGHVVLNNSAPTPVAVGAELTSVTGLRFRVTSGGLVQPGGLVEIAAVDSGQRTNLPEGTVLQWQSAPPYSDSKARVATGGLVNGTEDESDAELRARYYAHLSRPPSNCNAQSMCERAEGGSSAVQKAFVYAAIDGPATYALAVAASPTATNRSRQVAPTVVTNEVAPAVLGAHLDGIAGRVVSVVDQPVEHLTLRLTLPASPSAPVPGGGGGWLDAQPWPLPDAQNGGLPRVTYGGDDTHFAVDATVAPFAGVTRICWLSPFDWRLHTATVADTSPSFGGGHQVTLDKPFPGIAPGALIWPACERAQAYVDAILQAFAMMGPGEMTDLPPVLARSARYPRAAQGWPSELGGNIEKALTDSGSEVLGAQLLDALPNRRPTVNTSAPRILTPQHIGLYPAG